MPEGAGWVRDEPGQMRLPCDIGQECVHNTQYTTHTSSSSKYNTHYNTNNIQFPTHKQTTPGNVTGEGRDCCNGVEDCWKWVEAAAPRTAAPCSTKGAG